MTRLILLAAAPGLVASGVIVALKLEWEGALLVGGLTSVAGWLAQGLFHQRVAEAIGDAITVVVSVRMHALPRHEIEFVARYVDGLSKEFGIDGLVALLVGVLGGSLLGFLMAKRTATP